MAVVDYATTPDALAKGSLRCGSIAARLVVRIRCGGDRDAEASIMGAIADELADHHRHRRHPRSEDPGNITRDITVSIFRHPLRIIMTGCSDRGRAQRSGAHRYVLIAGKGHEGLSDLRDVRRASANRRERCAISSGRLKRNFTG